MLPASVLPDFASLDVTPLVYALVLGGLIGLEREWSGRAAGLRTHVLVCLSSTMLIMISQRMGSAVELDPEGRLVFDPNRMGRGHRHRNRLPRRGGRCCARATRSAG